MVKRGREDIIGSRKRIGWEIERRRQEYENVNTVDTENVTPTAFVGDGCELEWTNMRPPPVNGDRTVCFQERQTKSTRMTGTPTSINGIHLFDELRLSERESGLP